MIHGGGKKSHNKKSSTLVLGTIQICQRQKKTQHNVQGLDKVGEYHSSTEIECKSHMEFKIFIATLIKRKVKLSLINCIIHHIQNIIIPIYNQYEKYKWDVLLRTTLSSFATFLFLKYIISN